MPGRGVTVENRTHDEGRIQWLASFPEMNPNPVIEMDAHGVITFANSATQKTLRQMGLQENPALFIDDNKEEILRLLKEGSEFQVYREITLNTACFSEYITFIRELQVVRIYAVNISERKRVEEELARKNDELTALNERLTAIQEELKRKKTEAEYRKRAAEYAKVNVALEEVIRQRNISDSTLKKTLSLLNASLESTADGIIVIDQVGRITGYNQNFMNMWDIPRDLLESGENYAVTRHVLPELKNPEEFLASIRELQAHPARESFDMIEFNDGRIFERYSKPQKIGDRVVGRVWSYRDITDRKRAEEKLVASLEEKEVLLREIHHRVKNNLQLISGLLDMTRMRTGDTSTNSILTDMMLKIQTMAQIHTRLYESRLFGKISLTDQIRDQIAALSNIFSHKGHEIACEISSREVFLPVDQAIPCALVVNEILSNAFKHAFKGRDHGTIDISVMQEDKKIRIAITDDGIGIPDNFDLSRSNSLGLKLIRTLVEYQLKGSVLINRKNGTEMIVEFPVVIMET